MMIPAARSVFLLSLFTFLGTHARNLPEDKFKISKVDYGLTSSIASIIRPPRKSPPSPQVNPPTHPIMSDKIIRMPRFIGKTHSPPPPAPYVAPPHDQANAYERWASIFATRGMTLEPSHLSQQVPYARGKLGYVTEVPEDNEIIKRPNQSPPPPPHLAPPQGMRSS